MKNQVFLFYNIIIMSLGMIVFLLTLVRYSNNFAQVEFKGKIVAVNNGDDGYATPYRDVKCVAIGEKHYLSGINCYAEDGGSVFITQISIAELKEFTIFDSYADFTSFLSQVKRSKKNKY